MTISLGALPSIPIRECEKALATRVIVWDQLRSGRNSRVYRLTTETRQDVLLKIYPKDHSGCPRGLKTEWQAFEWLHQHHVTNVPKPIVKDEHHWAIYSYIHGQSLRETLVSDTMVMRSLDFLLKLKALSLEKAVGFDQFQPAADSLLDEVSFLANMNDRLHRLRQAAIEQNDGSLLAFLVESYEPIFAIISENIKSSFQSGSLPVVDRQLSPSDFGFHNAVHNKSGDLSFVDFEYFGWDDPVKMLCDYWLHPGMVLTFEQRKMFVQNFVEQSSQPQVLVQRLQSFFPLIVLKWTLILLNEFLHQESSRRRHAGYRQDGLIKNQQLQKARSMLQRVGEGEEIL